MRLVITVGVCTAMALGVPAIAFAQDPQHAGHEQMHMSPAGWHFMEDGVVFALFNQQGGPRGGREFVAPNWWMGMAMRDKGRHQFNLSAMLSLDAATVGRKGYRELFQAGEALDGQPVIDRQHPHDLFMQLSGSWRIQLNSTTALTFAGGPVGEPTLGPAAYMHRPSASGLVFAPLGHHTFDSTHISFGVATASLDRGRWTIEGSVFNGREPDDHRWDFDFGAMDSAAGRVWFRPSREWEFQVSSGRLRNPEELEPGDVTRTTASGSWFRLRGDSLGAVTAGYGVNVEHGERRKAFFGEFTVERGRHSLSARLNVQQLKGNVTVADMTAGATRRVASWRGFDGAVGAHVTFPAVPDTLRPDYCSRPVSFEIFFRLRVPAGMGRMWNMRMSRGHQAEDMADHR